MKQKQSQVAGRTAQGAVDHQAEHAKAVAAYRAQDFETALTHVNAAVRAQPGSAIYQADAGVILLALGRSEEAVIPLRRATELDPSHADAHYNLGEAYQDLGKKDDAIEAFRKAVALNRGLGWRKIKSAIGRWFGRG